MRKWLNLESRVRWSDRIDRDANPLEFYRDHYNGITRGVLYREDPGLYFALQRAKLFDKVPVFRKVDNIRTVFTPDPVAYYKNHYNGMTRGRLKVINPSLYQTMWRANLLYIVPMKHKQLSTVS